MSYHPPYTAAYGEMLPSVIRAHDGPEFFARRVQSIKITASRAIGNRLLDMGKFTEIGQEQANGGYGVELRLTVVSPEYGQNVTQFALDHIRHQAESLHPDAAKHVNSLVDMIINEFNAKEYLTVYEATFNGN